MTLSDKPFMGSVTSAPNARDTIAMAEIVFGKESLDETPAIISLINVNSPLRYDDRMLSALVEYAKAGQATIVTPFLLMGAMSPVSVAATLAQQVGEALAGIALVQTIRPGCPVVFGSFLSNTDMQSARRTSAPRSRRSACSAPDRSRATTTCRSAAAERSRHRRSSTRSRRTRR